MLTPIRKSHRGMRARVRRDDGEHSEWFVSCHTGAAARLVVINDTVQRVLRCCVFFAAALLVVLLIVPVNQDETIVGDVFRIGDAGVVGTEEQSRWRVCEMLYGACCTPMTQGL